MQKGNGGDWWRLLKDVARISDMVFCGAPAQLEPLGAFLVPASPVRLRTLWSCLCELVCATCAPPRPCRTSQQGDQRVGGMAQSWL